MVFLRDRQAVPGWQVVVPSAQPLVDELKSTDMGLNELWMTSDVECVEVVTGGLDTLALPAKNSPAPKTTIVRLTTSRRAYIWPT